MSVPILKHMYTEVYAVVNDTSILDIFSDPVMAEQYVELYPHEKLQIIKTNLEILVGEDNE